MSSNDGISKYDWQYIICAVILISVFIFTDFFRVFDKEYLYYYSGFIREQPHRIFTSILIHANFNHLLTNLVGIVITRYFLMKLGIKSKLFYLQFILICSYIDFFIIWIYEKTLSYFFNIIPNYIALGFSGIIYAFLDFCF